MTKWSETPNPISRDIYIEYGLNVTAIYALGLLDWLIGPGLRQGYVYGNPPAKNEWMNEWMNFFFMSKRREWSPTDPFNLGINTHQ